MPNYKLRVHVNKLKLLVPLHSSNSKLYIKITGKDESKNFKVPSLNHKQFEKKQGIIDLQEDMEFTLDQGCNKLSIHVYASRTFMDDILLFHNDVSLKKVLSSEGIVKLECKLFNIDKVHVAYIYLEMQRQGAVMLSNDFISNITQQLNLESTKLINSTTDEIPNREADPPQKTGGFLSGLGSKKKSDEKIAPSPLEFTSQILGLPLKKFGNSQQSKDEDSKAIPNFDAFELSDNFQRFVKSLDYPVMFYEYIYSVFMIESVKETLLFLLLATFAIIFYEIMICALPMVVVVFIFYNFYMKRTFRRPDVNYIKNMRFIQMLMGQSSLLVSLAYEFIEDFIFWKQPDKSIMLIKEFLKLSGLLCVALYLIPMRYFVVIGLWGGVLCNSPFCISLITILVKKAIIIADFFIEKAIQLFLRRKNLRVNKIIEFPFSHFYSTIKKYLSRKFEKRLKKIGLQRVKSINEDKKAIVGEEHHENSPFVHRSEKSLKLRQMSSLEDLKKCSPSRPMLEDTEPKKSSFCSNNQGSQSQRSHRDSILSPSVEEPNQQKSTLSKQMSPLLEPQPLLHQWQDEGYEEDDDTPMPEVVYNKEGTITKAGVKKRVFVTYENQRWWVTMWTNTLLPGERDNWSDMNGQMYLPKEHFKLPSKDWEWETIWYVDQNHEFTDPEGWSYANDFTSNFHKTQGTFDVVRRRKWVRVCYQKPSAQSTPCESPEKLVNVSPTIPTKQ